MKLLPLAASFLAPVAEAEPAVHPGNWLGWRPHDSSDAEKLIGSYDAELALEKADAAAVHQEAAARVQRASKPLSLAKTKEERPVVAVDDDPYGIRTNAQLQSYFGGSKQLRAGHASFSTSWHVTPKKTDHKQRQQQKHVPEVFKYQKQDPGARYLAELYGLPVAPAAAEAKAPMKTVTQVAPPSAGQSFGHLIDGPLRDAVLQAAAMEAEEKAKHPKKATLGMSEVLSWTAPSAREPVLSNAQVGSRVTAGYSLQSQEAADKAAAERGNAYMFDLLPDKDQVQLEAKAAEKVAPKHSKKENGYLNDIVPASLYVSS